MANDKPDILKFEIYPGEYTEYECRMTDDALELIPLNTVHSGARVLLRVPLDAQAISLLREFGAELENIGLGSEETPKPDMLKKLWSELPSVARSEALNYLEVEFLGNLPRRAVKEFDGLLELFGFPPWGNQQLIEASLISIIPPAWFCHRKGIPLRDFMEKLMALYQSVMELLLPLINWQRLLAQLELFSGMVKPYIRYRSGALVNIYFGDYLSFRSLTGDEIDKIQDDTERAALGSAINDLCKGSSPRDSIARLCQLMVETTRDRAQHDNLRSAIKTHMSSYFERIVEYHYKYNLRYQDRRRDLVPLVGFNPDQALALDIRQDYAEGRGSIEELAQRAQIPPSMVYNLGRRVKYHRRKKRRPLDFFAKS